MEQNTTFSKHKVRELRNYRLPTKQKPLRGHSTYVTCDFRIFPRYETLDTIWSTKLFFLFFSGNPFESRGERHALLVSLFYCCERYMEGLRGIERNHRRTAVLKNVQQQTLQGCKGFPLRPNHLVDPHAHRVRTGQTQAECGKIWI